MILFILATIGLTAIITDSTIFNPIRALIKKYLPYIGAGIECWQCVGFWSGIFMGFLLITDNLILLLIMGCVGSGLSLFASAILNRIER